jgi:hypothetical protein
VVPLCPYPLSPRGWSRCVPTRSLLAGVPLCPYPLGDGAKQNFTHVRAHAYASANALASWSGASFGFLALVWLGVRVSLLGCGVALDRDPRQPPVKRLGQPPRERAEQLEHGRQ